MKMTSELTLRKIAKLQKEYVKLSDNNRIQERIAFQKLQEIRTELTEMHGITIVSAHVERFFRLAFQQPGNLACSMVGEVLSDSLNMAILQVYHPLYTAAVVKRVQELVDEYLIKLLALEDDALVLVLKDWQPDSVLKAHIFDLKVLLAEWFASDNDLLDDF
ncbi:hypothetical protein [Anaerospora sp.]|uniref:hypothetical protein n=1 Tax=Anaerospora sp. TaxID=1960278 RepID=UPI00289B156B|nr:hypothetical protein [Anaerospora sp.]